MDADKYCGECGEDDCDCQLEKLQAENAALKEQVARLEDLNRKLCDKTNTLTIQSARLEETITTLQSKSAALVDALTNCHMLAARHRKEEWAQHIIRFCKDSVSTSPLRDAEK